MKIAVVGSGAVGGLIGAFLTAAGEDVIMIDSRKDLVDRVNNEGQVVRVVNNGETICAKSKMVHSGDLKELPEMELVICCTKGFATREAMQNAKCLIGRNTAVLSIQNGWGNVEQIRDVLNGDDSMIIAGVFYSSVNQEQGKPNHLNLVYGTDIVKAAPVNAHTAADINKIADTFSSARLKFTIVDSYVDIIWNKLIANTVLPVAAVLGLTLDEFLKYETSRKIVVRVFEESIAVAKAIGIKFDDPQNPIGPDLKILEDFRAAEGKNQRGTMPLDIINGRKTEIDIINGAVVTEGKKHGVPTPVNESLVMLVKVMEERNAAGKLYNYDRNKLSFISNS